MPPAVLSASCTAAIVLMLAVRGAENWSGAFATTWYGLFGVAFVSGLIGLRFAAGRRVAPGRRLLIVLLSLPALVAVPVFVVIVISLAPYAD